MDYIDEALAFKEEWEQLQAKARVERKAINKAYEKLRKKWERRDPL